MYDAVVVGAGLAGLQTSRCLARGGARVLLVDRKNHPEEHVQTTGIFVRKTLEDFELPDDVLGPALRRVSLHGPWRAALDLESDHDEFRIGRMGRLYQYLLRDCVQRGVVWSPATSFEHSEADGAGSLVTLRRGQQKWCTRAQLIVGADGASSRVAADLKLDRNREWIVGVEDVYETRGGTPSMHCFVDPQIAPGYIGWVVDDGEELHLGVGGYLDSFSPLQGLEALRLRVERELGTRFGARRERRGGKIPVGGVLEHIGCRRGVIVGDAAGAVSPLTAGGLDAALRLSRYAATVMLEALESCDRRRLDLYRGGPFRARFVSRLWMRRAFRLLSTRVGAECAVGLLALSPMQHFAHHVFFGRGSFPEPSEVMALTTS